MTSVTPTGPAETTAAGTDGRAARAARTRIAVIDALLALLRSGNIVPTAHEIAELAGVSERSVYHHFQDLDALFVAASDRQIELLADLPRTAVPGDGSLRSRAEAVVASAGEVYGVINWVLLATARAIKVIVYQGQPDPLQQALVGEAGADTDPTVAAETAVDYLTMLDDVYETYGRRIDAEIVKATGGPADATAAQADARTIIDKEPFAVLGGPAQTPAYWEEITAAGILCLGTCSLAEGWDNVEDAAPYLWPVGPAPEQADRLLADLVGKQLVGKPAEFAGDEAMQDQERVFGWVQAETETGEYAERNDAFDMLFADEYDGEIAARSTYLFDPAAAQEAATTVVARMKDAGVTTIIMSVDPLIPATITAEATKQGYFPEWVIGPSVLADTTIFGRTYDQEQWAHAIGLSLPSARAGVELSDSYAVYEWYFDEPPPSNTHGVILPGAGQFMLGVHLAGPDLTPESFEQGLFRYPPAPSGKTYPYVSWGEELWGRADYNSSDDATAIWWDPDATGEDETGNEGTGMLRYVDGGTRYLPGEWPTEPMSFFEEEGSVTVYDELPESDALPDYPPWPGSPAE